MAKKVFVINTATVVASSTIAAAATNALITAKGDPAAVTAGDKDVEFVQKSVDGSIIRSNAIDSGELVAVDTSIFFPGQAQVVEVDLTNATGSLYISIVDMSEGTAQVYQKTFDEPTAAAIAAAINIAGADSGSPFKGYAATEAGGIVTITAPINKMFRAAASEGATQSTTDAYIPTSGTAADAQLIEFNGLPYRGIENVAVGFPVVKPDSEISLTGEYDIVTSKFSLRRSNKASADPFVYEDLSLTFICKRLGGDTAGQLGAVATAVKAEVLKLK